MQSANKYEYHGNAVRKASATRPAQRELEQPKKRSKGQPKRNVSKTTRRNQDKALAVNKGYAFLLGLAVLATLGMCVSYLSVQAKVTLQARTIAQKQQTLSSLVDENNATQERLNNMINLNYVYKQATQKYGMVYADEDHIVFYDGSSLDYLSQYSDIPAVD